MPFDLPLSSQFTQFVDSGILILVNIYAVEMETGLPRKEKRKNREVHFESNKFLVELCSRILQKDRLEPISIWPIEILIIETPMKFQ